MNMMLRSIQVSHGVTWVQTCLWVSEALFQTNLASSLQIQNVSVGLRCHVVLHDTALSVDVQIAIVNVA